MVSRKIVAPFRCLLNLKYRPLLFVSDLLEAHTPFTSKLGRRGAGRHFGLMQLHGLTQRRIKKRRIKLEPKRPRTHALLFSKTKARQKERTTCSERCVAIPLPWRRIIDSSVAFEPPPPPLCDSNAAFDPSRCDGQTKAWSGFNAHQNC